MGRKEVYILRHSYDVEERKSTTIRGRKISISECAKWGARILLYMTRHHIRCFTLRIFISPCLLLSTHNTVSVEGSTMATSDQQLVDPKVWEDLQSKIDDDNQLRDVSYDIISGKNKTI